MHTWAPAASDFHCVDFRRLLFVNAFFLPIHLQSTMELVHNNTLHLGDVENSSIASIWIRIYQNLDWKDIVKGRQVCKTLNNELPLLITHLRCKAMSSSRQRVKQLDTLAIAFTNLSVLELGRPTSMALEPAEGLMDWQPHMCFPALKQLQVHVDVAGCIRLRSHALPVIETLLLASDVRHCCGGCSLFHVL